MTLLFIDGFDHYATADLTKKYASSTGSGHGIFASSGRRGGGAYGDQNASALFQITKNLTAGASFVIGFAVYFVAGPGAVRSICQLLDGGTVQCGLAVNADLTLSVVRSTSTTVTGGTSTVALSTGTWHYLEWKVTIADSISASSCVVRFNGVDIITVATGQDLKATANASANAIALGPNASFGSDAMYFDDYYICNQSGSSNNDFLGDCRVDTLYPSADGTYSAFTPSTGSTHYTLVDETTPNTSDYNDGAAVNDRDSYAFGSLSALTSQTVYGVQVNAAILKDDAGAKSAATFARSVSTNTDGASVGLSTSQVYLSQVFEQDPNAAAAWTESTVNAAEFGVKVTA